MLPWVAGLVLLLGVAIGAAFWGTASFAQTTLPDNAVTVIKAGAGDMPGPTDVVTVRYKGTLPNGQVFDETPPGQTADFPLDRVVPGFSQGLQRMRPGEKARINIPPALGYPEGTPDGAIPPGSNIVFEVELIRVVKQP